MAAMVTAVFVAVCAVAVAPVWAAPVKDPHAAFTAVSCPSASFCLAVGVHVAPDGKTFVPFTETFDGKSWKVNTAAVPGSDAVAFRFTAVSCVDRAFCVATTYRSSGAPSALRWNGKTWAAVKLGGAAPSELTDVQCRSKMFCMMTGSTTNRRVAAVWHYNGYAWYPQTLPSPRTHTVNRISCPTVKICFVAGYTHPGYAYVVRWGGNGWHASYLPRHVGALLDITCLTTVRCTAIGNGSIYSKASGLVVDLANGKWTYSYVTPTKVDAGSLVYGDALACTAVACTAILAYEPTGDANIGYLIAVRNNNRQFVLGAQRFPDLQGLTCTGASCIVVGSTYEQDRNGPTMAEIPTSATAYRRHNTTLSRFAVPQP